MNYSILINTCDKFEDCWNPFFKLWSLYWKDCTGKVYLNTEYKDYSYPGLDIITVKGCAAHGVPRNKRTTWSQCLKWALEAMDADIVLYMQEDYFLTGPVKNDLIEKYVKLIESRDDIQCIQLTRAGIWTGTNSEFDGLCNAKPDAWRLSCQAALWKKQELLALIRDWESAWEFEGYGNKRSIIMGNRYLVVSPGLVKPGEFEIIPYIFTGIIQGRWYEKVVPLFQKHRIKVDYSARGFVGDAPKRSIAQRIRHRLKTTMQQPKVLSDFISLGRRHNRTLKSILKIWATKY